jgi:hypothetical protein
MKRQLDPLPLTGVAVDLMKVANPVDVETLTHFLTPASLERVVLYVTKPIVFAVEQLAQELMCSPPEAYVAAQVPYVKALSMRKVKGHLIVNPMETTSMAPITTTVRYMTTECLMDWLAEVDNPWAVEMRASLMWVLCYAGRRAGRSKIAERDARIDELERRIEDAEKMDDRLAERDSVISQLQSDLGRVLFDLDRAKRRMTTLEKSVMETASESDAYLPGTKRARHY